jgi:two-component system, sensor histidine kinase and response regulator
MSAPQSTAKRRSAVTGWLPHLDHGTGLIWIGFAAALIAAAIVVWSALNNANNFAQRSIWITHTQNVLEVLGAARASNFSALTATQEYFRSGDSKRMDGLLDDLSQLRRGAATLRTLTSDNPSQERRVDGLDLLIDRLFKQARLVMQMAAVHGLAQVAAAPESVELSSGFGEAARTLGEMTAEEDRLMTRRTEDARMVSRRSTAATTIGSVVIFWLLVVGFYNIRLSTRANQSAEDLAASRENLQKLNTTLEQRISERTAALLEQTSLVSSIFESAPEGMMTVTSEGIMTSWNPGAERLFGYTAAEVIGKSAGVLMAEGEEWLVDVGVKGKNRPTTQTFEARRLRKDGVAIEVVVTVAPTRSAAGQSPAFAVIYHDNTQGKLAQAEMEAARDLALEAARVRSEFLTSMSHEVRTPLNAIIGLTELLMLSDLSPAQHQQMDQIRSSGELLLTIVKDILDFSKLAAGKVVLEEVSFSLDHLVEETIHDFVAPAAHKGIELALFVAPGITGNLRGDPNRLRQILNNLLSNAVKFTHRGEVSLSVAKVREINNDLLLSFEVRDSGIGIPRELQRRLFQPFAQADSSTARKYGGTGLGLVIAASLVKQMAGEIGFESESGKGSTFHFTARFERDAAQAGVAKLVLREDSFAGTRAIVATPSATNRRMLSEYLSLWGISNMSMNTAAGALQELREAAVRGAPFHLALVEATLAEVGGPTLIQEMKRDPALAGIKVLAIGPLAPAATTRDADGADATISKPIRLSQLLNCLMALLQGNRPEAHKAVVGDTQGKSAMVEEDNAAARKFVKVLVVDDNLVNSSLARTQLEKLGYTAEVANDGYGALKAVALRRYDIILMDCEMPGMDGYTATAEIRLRESSGHRTTIIAMTAHAMASMRAHCLASGMDDFLAKPVKLLPLAAMLDRWAFGEFAGQRNVPAAAAPHAQNETRHDDSLQVEGFDLSTIRELRSLSDVATEDVFLELVATYRSELSVGVAALESAVASRDVEAIRKLAHALKGSSLTLGAAGFGALCEGVQKSAQGSQIEKTQIEETIVRTRELIAHAADLPDQLEQAGAAATL